MWKNTDDTKNNFISLHDCRATNAAVQKDKLLLVFNNGFWISSEDERNPFGNTVRTDKAEIQFTGFDVSAIYGFKEYRFFRRLVSTKRVSINLEKLITKINDGSWELEFLYEYHTYKGVLYDCWIWMKQRPYHMECQIVLGYADIEYHWNNLCEDKPW